MSSELSPEQIAEVCHEANRALTRHTNDVPVQPAWMEAPDEMRVSSIAGVSWRLANLDAPASASHDAWMAAKIADGWTFGPVKDAEKKTHPALRPYNELPSEVRLKDVVFTAIVQALSTSTVYPRAKSALGEAIAKLEQKRRQPSLTDEDLNRWFTYHPPTDVQKLKYDAIDHAEGEAAASIGTNHDAINAALRAFVVAIDKHAPDSADKTAAIRCVRIARNAANEALVLDVQKRTQQVGDAAWMYTPQLEAIARVELRKARWQAKAAIACGGK